MDLMRLAPLFDTLIVDGPTPPDSLWSESVPCPSAEPIGGGVLPALAALLAPLPDPLAVWLDGSVGSVLLASVARAMGREVLGVTTHVQEVRRVDDGGDAAAALGLQRRRVELHRGLAETWALLAERAAVPPADLLAPSAAVTAQQSGAGTLLLGAGAEVLLGELDVPPVGRVRTDSEADARGNYGCLPPRWGEWRLRMGLRRELIEPDLAQGHPSLLGAPPRPPLSLAGPEEDRAAYALDSAMHADGYLRPLLSSASDLAGARLVAPLADPLFRSALQAAPEGPRRALRRLLRERVPSDLGERPRRAPLGLEAMWLLGEPLPGCVAQTLAPGALARQGWFDPVTVAHWLQLVRAQPRDAVNRLRGRMLVQVAALSLRLATHSVAAE